MDKINLVISGLASGTNCLTFGTRALKEREIQLTKQTAERTLYNPKGQWFKISRAKGYFVLLLLYTVALDGTEGNHWLGLSRAFVSPNF